MKLKRTKEIKSIFIDGEVHVFGDSDVIEVRESMREFAKRCSYVEIIEDENLNEAITENQTQEDEVDTKVETEDEVEDDTENQTENQTEDQTEDDTEDDTETKEEDKTEDLTLEDLKSKVLELGKVEIKKYLTDLEIEFDNSLKIDELRTFVLELN